LGDAIEKTSDPVGIEHSGRCFFSVILHSADACFRCDTKLFQSHREGSINQLEFSGQWRQLSSLRRLDQIDHSVLFSTSFENCTNIKPFEWFFKRFSKPIQPSLDSAESKRDCNGEPTEHSAFSGESSCPGYQCAALL
jgi:hypothetical protein